MSHKLPKANVKRHKWLTDFSSVELEIEKAPDPTTSGTTTTLVPPLNGTEAGVDTTQTSAAGQSETPLGDIDLKASPSTDLKASPSTELIPSKSNFYWLNFSQC